MPYLFYKLIHLIGIFMVLLSFGGMVMYAANGGGKAENKFRKNAAITHGVGMFLILLGGFGTLAKLGIHFPWPGWVFIKVVIWLIFGGIIAVVYRKAALSNMLWYGALALAGVAAYLALYKPF